MISRTESLIWILVSILVDGFVVDLDFSAPETLRCIWLVALALGKLLQSFSLAAHGALNFHHLLTSTILADDGFGDL